MGALLSIPSSIVSSLAINAACCFGQQACRCLCNIGSCKSSTATRIAYALLFLLNSVTAWIFLSPLVDEQLAKLNSSTYGLFDIKCPDGVSCHGYLAVYRITTSLACFHLLLMLLTVGVRSSNEFRAGIQNGYWGPKILVLSGMTVGFFFIPNAFFNDFVYWVAFAGAFFFVLVQLLLLVDFVHSVAEKLIRNYEESDSFESSSPRWIWAALLVGTSIFNIVASVVAAALLFVFFGKEGCQLNQTLVSVSLIGSVISCVISIVPKVQEVNPKSGLLQASCVAVYNFYLVGSALLAEPPLSDEAVTALKASGKIPDDLADPSEYCNPWSHSTQQFMVILGAIGTLVAVAYSAARAAASSKTLMGNSSNEYEALPVEDGVSSRSSVLRDAVDSGALPKSALDGEGSADDNDDDGNGKVRYPRDDEKDGVAYNYSFFHLIFACASMYLALQVTDWNRLTLNESASNVTSTSSSALSHIGNLLNSQSETNSTASSMLFASIGHNWASVWIKVVSGWVVMAMYLWTVVAPLFFPDRDFS